MPVVSNSPLHKQSACTFVAYINITSTQSFFCMARLFQFCRRSSSLAWSYLRSWIQYKIMLFVYAWVLIELRRHQAFAYLLMNRLYTYDAKNSIQYCFKLATSTHNPAYNSVFDCKFKRSFDLKPKQMPPLGIQLQPELQAVGFKKNDVLHCSVPSKPPWLLKRL